MSNWSNQHHHFASAKADFDDPDFRPGLDLTLNQLLETRVKPVIQWQEFNSRVKTNRVGGFRSRFKGRGMDFDESRIYQIGDDIRNIDWRVTARTGEAHTKIFKEERERPVFVLLDQMPSMFFGTAQVFKSILASHITAQLMWSTLANGDRFGALLFGEETHFEKKPSSNRRNCMRLLSKIVENHQTTLEKCFTEQLQKTALNEQKQEKENPFKASLRRLKHLAKPGSVIHIVSDFNHFDEDCEKQLSRISQHTDLHCVLINDPIESKLPPAGLYGISDGFSDGILDTNSTSTRNNYQLDFSNKKQKIQDFVIKHKGLFNCIDTNYQQDNLNEVMRTKGLR